jgi:hypothetical protein
MRIRILLLFMRIRLFTLMRIRIKVPKISVADPDPKLTSGRIRNRIRNFCFGSPILPKMMQFHADPDPQHSWCKVHKNLLREQPSMTGGGGDDFCVTKRCLWLKNISPHSCKAIARPSSLPWGRVVKAKIRCQEPEAIEAHGGFKYGPVISTPQNLQYVKYKIFIKIYVSGNVADPDPNPDRQQWNIKKIFSGSSSRTCCWHKDLMNYL